MATLVDRPGLCFGIPTQEQREWPIVGLPADACRVRWRFRNDDFARLFVRTSSGVRSFVPQLGCQEWIIDEKYEQGANQSHQ